MKLIGLTIGDPAGVGPEVVLKAHRDVEVRSQVRLAVLGSRQVLEYYLERHALPLSVESIQKPEDAGADPSKIYVLDVNNIKLNMIPGRVDAACGKLAFDALSAAARFASERRIDAVVTAPTNKTSFRAAGYDYEGQTEMFGGFWKCKLYGMLVIGGPLRVLLLTRHMSLREALSRITAETTRDHLLLLKETLIKMGIDRPRLALAGLNPHAGEGGIFGMEDIEILKPAAAAARDAGVDTTDPLPADSLFGRAFRGEFDGVLALYHDQGLIAPKIVANDRAVTVIAGAPHLRVSVIHGAGFDRAGQNRADATNMIAAIQNAAAWCDRWNS